MDRQVYRARTAVLCDWFDALRAAARTLEPAFEPVPVRAWMGGAELVACVRSLGGAIRPLTPFYGWVLSEIDYYRGSPPMRDFAPELVADGASITDFHGLMAVELEQETTLALRADEHVSPFHVDRALVLAGRTLEGTLGLAARLRGAQEKLFGNRVRAYGTHLRPSIRLEVREDDLILPEEFKGPLFNYLDRFWRAASLCTRLRISPTRGVLFVGAPGTGKSLTIRHLLSRYPNCRRYVFLSERYGSRLDDSDFQGMLEKIREEETPAVVVIEDVDRLFDSGCVTREFFLNVLDGLFQPAQPVLWLATSNDPSRLEKNLLDRPGRFDRIFVFPRPGLEERTRMIERYSAWPVQEDVVRKIARDSDGLTGAHLREVCCSAALAVAEARGRYDEALREELTRVVDQHERASKYEFQLEKARPAGFGG